MTTLILSPKSPPKQCGVGDHAYKLWRTFRNEKKEVFLLSSLNVDSENELCNLEINLQNIIQINQKFKLKTIIIEYTPNIWANNGRNLDFELFEILNYLDKNKIEIITYFHEGRYPIISDLRGAIFGPIQLLWARKVYNLSKKIIFSSEEVKKQFPHFLFPEKQNIILPVGSNIQPINVRNYDPSSQECRIVIYAKAHPTKLEKWNINALKIIIPKYPEIKFKVYLIGVNEDNNYHVLNKFQNLALKSTGYLDEKELSKLLTESDLLLSPYKDGVGTRRGGLFSGMAHELKIISNAPKLKSSYDWAKAIYLADKEADFIKQIEIAMNDIKTKNFNKNQEAFKMYQTYFSFEQNISALIKYINEK